MSCNKSLASCNPLSAFVPPDLKKQKILGRRCVCSTFVRQKQDNIKTRKLMKLVLIGAGRLATNLGRALLNAGHDIMQVYSRTMESAQEAAAIMGGMPVTSIDRITKDADVYICAVSDAALPDLLPMLCKGREQKVWLHTAGSLSMDMFKGMALHYGVLYPMQTFSKETVADFSHIPCFVEANDEMATRTIVKMATDISDNVSPLSSEDRKYLHLAAVFACNFTNHCYTMAADLLEKHGMDFSVMLPLIDETARKVHTMHPRKAQTGPAVRYDENVIRAQSQLLRNNPFAKEIYDRMSISIHKKSH